MSDEKPKERPDECVRCESDAIRELARVGIVDKYACAECWAVFEWPTGEVTGEVCEEWRDPDAAERVRDERMKNETAAEMDTGERVTTSERPVDTKCSTDVLEDTSDE